MGVRASDAAAELLLVFKDRRESRELAQSEEQVYTGVGPVVPSKRLQTEFSYNPATVHSLRYDRPQLHDASEYSRF